MKKTIETLALSELFIFYGFILKDKSIILEILFYFLALLFMFVLFIKPRKLYYLIGIIAGVFALFNFRAQNTKIMTLLPLNKAECLYCELLASPEKLNDAYYSIKARAISINSASAVCSASGNVTVITKAMNLQSSLPGKILKRRGDYEHSNLLVDKGLYIFCSGRFSEDGADVLLKNKNPVFFADSFFTGERCAYKNKFLELRALVRFKLKHILQSFSKAGNLLTALILGSRDYLDLSMKLLFQKAGLSHVLALSGLHLSVMCTFAQRTADFFKRKKQHLLVMAAFSFLFVFTTGSQPSLVRALIFICINCICSFFNIKCRKGSVFYLSLSIHIILQPEAAFSMSFLLSYSAIYGIIFLRPWIFSFADRFFPEKGRKLKELFAVSAGAQIATIPVQIFILNSFSLKGIISSVAAVPLISLFVISGIFAILLVLILPESTGFFKIGLTFIYNIINLLVQFFSRL